MRHFHEIWSGISCSLHKSRGLGKKQGIVSILMEIYQFDKTQLYIIENMCCMFYYIWYGWNHLMAGLKPLLTNWILRTLSWTSLCDRGNADLFDVPCPFCPQCPWPSMRVAERNNGPRHLEGSPNPRRKAHSLHLKLKNIIITMRSVYHNVLNCNSTLFATRFTQLTRSHLLPFCSSPWVPAAVNWKENK